MADRLPASGPPHVDGAALRALLERLDDLGHAEHPADVDLAAARARFTRLGAALQQAFDHPCDIDNRIQDATHHGRITVPAQATDTGERLVLVVSNVGDMVVCAVQNPGAYSDEDTDALVTARG